MVREACTAQLNSASLISASASSLQANIYQLIGLKAAPVGRSAFWRQLNMAQAAAYGAARCANKGQTSSLTPGSCGGRGASRKL